MIPFWKAGPGGPREERPRARTRRLRAELTVLEDRQLFAIGTVTATAVPSILTPPNGRFVAVTISGTFTQVVTTHLGSLSTAPPQAQLDQIDARNAAKAGPSPVIVRTTDEYRRLEPRVNVAARLTSTRTFFDRAAGGVPALEGLLRNYSYTTTLFLQAKSSNQTADGRHYDINVAVEDGDGANSVTTPVEVPKPDNPIPPPHTLSLSQIAQIRHAATPPKHHHRKK